VEFREPLPAYAPDLHVRSNPSYTNPNAYADEDADARAIANAYIDVYTIAHFVADHQPYRDADANRNGHRDANANQNTNSHADLDTGRPYGNANAHVDLNTDADRDANPHAHGNRYARINEYAHGNTYLCAYANPCR
jgi:hypothetical protein